jgi:hypothetical protein
MMNYVPFAWDSKDHIGESVNMTSYSEAVSVRDMMREFGYIAVVTRRSGHHIVRITKTRQTKVHR